MRGTLSGISHLRPQPGIIPAYAGNTCRITGTPSDVRDHPRVCGEHYTYDSADITGMGSSPRMRGTLAFGHDLLAAPGIIPAYAGNTELAGTAYMAGRDHPRVCGEHLYLLLLALVIVGSSPRMRGTLQSGRVHFVDFGIIPAYAGNTIIHNSYPLIHRDHPRVCGEHFIYSMAFAGVKGSSPRMRGTRLFHPPRRPPTGIIPAYAGNTWWAISPAPTAWDHPRVCGEHVGLVAHVCEYEGSSPRMRGTPPRRPFCV